MRTDTPQAWRELGRDLARLHAADRLDEVATLADAEALSDPRQLLEQRGSQGWFTALETRWLGDWIECLAPAVSQPVSVRLLHLDTQAANVLVQPVRDEYVALIDWGCAAWGDPA